MFVQSFLSQPDVVVEVLIANMAKDSTTELSCLLMFYCSIEYLGLIRVHYDQFQLFKADFQICSVLK